MLGMATTKVPGLALHLHDWLATCESMGQHMLLSFHALSVILKRPSYTGRERTGQRAIDSAQEARAQGSLRLNCQKRLTRWSGCTDRDSGAVCGMRFQVRGTLDPRQNQRILRISSSDRSLSCACNICTHINVRSVP
jgi:hypothetical protein